MADVRQTVIAIVSRFTGIPAEKVTDETPLGDIGQAVEISERIAFDLCRPITINYFAGLTVGKLVAAAKRAPD